MPEQHVRTQISQPRQSGPAERTIVIFSNSGQLPSGDLAESGPFTFTCADRVERILLGCGTAGATDSAFQLIQYDDEDDEVGTVIVSSDNLVLSGRRSSFRPTAPLSFVDGNAITLKTITDGGHLSVTVQLLRPKAT